MTLFLSPRFLFSICFIKWVIYCSFLWLQLAALSALLLVAVINFALGLLPYVDNFSNLGGFISGVLLGFVLLFSPRLPRMTEKKGGFFDYGVKKSSRLNQKLDRPVLRSVSFVLFGLVWVYVSFVWLAMFHC